MRERFLDRRPAHFFIRVLADHLDVAAERKALSAYSVSPFFFTQSLGPKPTEKVKTPTPDSFANKKWPNS